MPARKKTVLEPNPLVLFLFALAAQLIFLSYLCTIEKNEKVYIVWNLIEAERVKKKVSSRETMSDDNDDCDCDCCDDN